MVDSRAACQLNKPGPNVYPTYYRASQSRAQGEAMLVSPANLSVIKHSTDMVRELVTFLTRSKIEAILKKDKASSSLGLMPSFP